MALVSGASSARAEITTSTAASLKATIINKLDKKEDRNPLAEKAQQMREMRASTTAQIRDMRKDTREDIRDMRADVRASTTLMMREFKGERKEMMQKMQLRVFEMRKNNLVRELTNAISNLTNIRARISERITRAETNGRNMTDAKAKLVIADGKLATAQTAVDAFASFNYASSTVSVTASSSAEVDLERPRKVGDDAIKAVKAARDAFKDVVSAIAHGMGLGSGSNNTATTTATTTVQVTATTTASTTSN